MPRTKKPEPKKSSSKTRSSPAPPASSSSSPATLDKIGTVRHLAGITYQLKLIRCGKPKCRRCYNRPTHGPYWYAYWTTGARTRSKYIGKHLPRAVELDLGRLESAG